MGKTKVLIVLSVCNALSPLALQMIVPALPAIRIELEASLPQTQALLSAYSVALAISMLIYGPMADRFNRQHLLTFGMLLFSVGSVVGYFAQSIEVLIFSRVLQAVGAGSASTITRAIAADIFEGDDLNRAMSTMLMIVVIGPMLAPILGGYMVDNSSWADIMLFLFASGILLAVLGGYLLRNINLPPAHIETTSSYFKNVGALFSNAKFSNNMMILVVVQIGVYSFISISPYLIIEVLEYSALQYGFIFVYLAFGYMAGNFASRTLVGKFGGASLVYMASCLYLIGTIAFAFFVFIEVQNLWSITGPILLLIFANGIIQPNCSAGVLASVAGRKGVVASLAGFGQIISAAVGAQLMGFLDVTSNVPLLGVIVVCSIIALTVSHNLKKISQI